MLTAVPKVGVNISELQIEHDQNTGQGKVTLVLPELTFVVGIAVTEGRGCPVLALFHKTGKKGIFFFSPSKQIKRQVLSEGQQLNASN